ncbi:MAG: CHAT domain-containing protein, partial [Phycisphaerae bacterium]|nr:CHAT domain-containing protein [Phycisphaerae bacterium]
YVFLANCLSSLDRKTEAIQYYEKALLMQLRLYPGQDRDDIAQNFDNLADTYFSLGKYLVASNYYNITLNINTRLYPDQNNLNVASNYMDLGQCAMKTGRLLLAHELLEKSLNIKLKLSSSQCSLNYCFLGNTSYLLGRNMESIYYYKKALESSSGHNANIDMNVTRMHFLLACALVNAECYSEALPHLERVLDIITKNSFYISGIEINKLHLGIGKSLLGTNRYLEAIATLDKLLLDPDLEHSDIVSAHFFIGQTYVYLDKYAEALRYFKKAKQLSLDMYTKATLLEGVQLPRIYELLANCYYHLGDYANSYDSYKQSLQTAWNCFNKILPYVRNEQTKKILSGFELKKINDNFLNMLFQHNNIDLNIKQKKEDGFDVTLIFKNILSDVLQNEKHAFNETQDPILENKYRIYVILKKQHTNLATCELPQMNMANELKDSKEILKNLQILIEDLEIELRTSPEFAQKARLKEISVQDVHKALKPGQVLLEYVKYQVMDKNDPNDITLTDESHYAVFILQGGTDTIEAVDIGPAKPLEALLRDCKKLIKEQGMELGNNVTISKTLKERAEKKLADLLSQIKSQTLPPEVFDNIKNADRLYIAPTSALMQFPFEILPITSGKLDYMVNKYEMIYLNTSRDLVRLHLSSSNQQKVANREMCIIGNPNFNLLLDKYKKIASTIETPIPTPSQHAQAEIEDIFPDTKIMLASGGEGFHPSQKTDWRSFGYQLEAIKKIKCDLNNIYWGDNAVEEAFYANTDSRIINFATHGYYWENAPEGTNPLLRSMLVFAGINTYNTEMKNNPKFDPKINDCYLTAYEISGLDLSSTEFVNLVACQTGLGSDDDYQGVIGLRSSFILAGARSLSVSMWEVPAEASAIQMQNFYDLWLGESPMENKYQAFHQAQINALSKKGTSHPFFWAGFVYVGDPGDLVEIK